MTDAKRLATYSGVVAPVVAFAAILAAAVQSPSFSWTHSALSTLGARGAPTAPLFNGGLILAGVVALPFAWRLWVDAETRLQRVGTGLFGLSAVLMALVGAFPVPHPLHFAVAVPHFLTHMVGMWTYGAGALRAGDRTRGWTTVGLGVVHLLAWTAWGVAFRVLDPGPVPGLALPETFGALVFGGWVAATARRIALREEPTPSGTHSRTVEGN